MFRLSKRIIQYNFFFRVISGSVDDLLVWMCVQWNTINDAYLEYRTKLYAINIFLLVWAYILDTRMQLIDLIDVLHLFYPDTFSKDVMA
jgi:hypothetical protein